MPGFLVRKKPAIYKISARTLFFCLVAAGLIVVSGCATQPSFCTGQDHLSEAYKSTLCDWTKEARVYHGLDTGLFVTATLRSAAFLQGYAKEYARIYGLDKARTEKLEKDQSGALTHYVEFVFAAYTPKENINDFSRRKSTWKVYMQDETGKRVAPVEIRPLPENKEVAAYFFPYATPWNRVYVARFPVLEKISVTDGFSPDPKNLGLVIAGPPGTATLVWERPENGWH